MAKAMGVGQKLWLLEEGWVAWMHLEVPKLVMVEKEVATAAGLRFEGVGKLGRLVVLWKQAMEQQDEYFF